MRLSRTDFVPLTAIGASLTFGALVSWSPADDVPEPVQPFAMHPVPVRPAPPLTPDELSIVFEDLDWLDTHLVGYRTDERGRLYTFRSVDVASFELPALEEQLSRLRRITERLASDIVDLERERRSEILERLERDILERAGAERGRRDIATAPTVTLQN